ncbi:hypothetical protein K523DRAFT_71000 [Schizophyllum commune Tattone D]|nr:hypothetical protein K523DRAFT_71000 [Schizophyllum commune Tattone D]
MASTMESEWSTLSRAAGAPRASLQYRHHHHSRSRWEVQAADSVVLVPQLSPGPPLPSALLSLPTTFLRLPNARKPPQSLYQTSVSTPRSGIAPCCAPRGVLLCISLQSLFQHRYPRQPSTCVVQHTFFTRCAPLFRHSGAPSPF